MLYKNSQRERNLQIVKFTIALKSMLKNFERIGKGNHTNQ